jgi:hypothetical protein
MNVIMKINKYLSANVATNCIYDDNSIQPFRLEKYYLDWGVSDTVLGK